LHKQLTAAAAAAAAVVCRYDDGGMLKVTYSTAFTVSLLSWAFMQFKEGYRASGNLDLSANTVRCGAVHRRSICGFFGNNGKDSPSLAGNCGLKSSCSQ
jgi:hypothetical protein